MSGNSSTKKKTKYLSHFLTKSKFLFLNEREIIKVLFDTKIFYIYCSKVSPLTSVRNFSLFTIPSKTFSNASFFYCFNFLFNPVSFKSAISLTFVLYTCMVCNTMSNKQIIGPYFSEDETGYQQNYLQMSKSYFYPIMQKRFNNKMIFQ